MAEVKEAPAVTGQMPLRGLICGAAQQVSACVRSVVQANDGITDRIHIEVSYVVKVESKHRSGDRKTGS